MQVSIKYVDQKIIPSIYEGIDYGAERIIVAEFPQFGTQLIWQKGCKRWKDNMYGWKYYTGNFEYETRNYRCTKNQGFSYDLTEGQWSEYGLDPDEDRPKLNARWVRLMLVKCANIRDNRITGAKAIPYACVEAKPQYKRGKTMIIEWEDLDGDLDELHSAMVSLGVL